MTSEVKKKLDLVRKIIVKDQRFRLYFLSCLPAGVKNLDQTILKIGERLKVITK